MDIDDADNLLLTMLPDSSASNPQRSVWIRDSLGDRKSFGEFTAFWEKERSHAEEFHAAYRMSPARFDELLGRLHASIKHQDTRFRMTISPAERLAMTTR